MRNVSKYESDGWFYLTYMREPSGMDLGVHPETIMRFGSAGSEEKETMITADQILIHLIGDYVTQSDWMANEKTKRFFPAAVHAVVYSAGFVIFRPSIAALLVIVWTHLFIDRYRLARYVVWTKNFLGPVGFNKPWADCSGTGYPSERPAWLSVWLLIIADNILHLICNGLALRYL